MAEPTAEQVAAYKAAAEGEPVPTPAESAEPPAEPEAPPEPFVHTYADRAAAEAGIAEKDRYIEQLKQERQEAFNQAAQYEAMLAQGQQPQNQPATTQLLPDGQTPIYTMEHLQSFIDNGQISEFQASAIWADQQAQLRTYEGTQRIEERLSEYEPMRQHSAAQQTLDGARTLLGANADQLFSSNADVVDKAVTGDPSFYLDPSLGAQRLAFAVKAAEFDRLQGVTPATTRSTQGNVHVEGGSGAQPTPPAGTAAETDDNSDLKAAFVRPVQKDAYGTKPAWAGQG